MPQGVVDTMLFMADYIYALEVVKSTDHCALAC